jgi:hypothetical protein
MMKGIRGMKFRRTISRDNFIPEIDGIRFIAKT